MTKRRYYFDHNATSPLSATARAALVSTLDLGPINAGSVHQEGQRARALLERSRRTLRALLETPKPKVVFTGGATEANHLAITGLEFSGGGSVWTSRLEHPSLIASVESLATSGAKIHYFANDQSGGLILPTLDEFMATRPALVTITWANNELGNIQALEEIAELCSAANARLHVDGSQVVGRFDWRLPPGVGALTISGHKAGAPQGVGALIAEEDWPLGRGPAGGEQERGYRAGTENVAAIVALAAVITDPDPRWSQLEAVRDLLESALASEAGAIPLVSGRPRLPNTLSVSFPGADAEGLLMALDLAGVAVSTGSACSAGAIEGSHVVAALGLPDELAGGVLRLSLGPEHSSLSEQEISSIAERFARVVDATHQARQLY